MSYYNQLSNAFVPKYLSKLQAQILSCPYFAINNLNSDFIGTKGFSVVFQRSGQDQVIKRFPFFQQYLNQALHSDCNAFYLNPLLLSGGSRVQPHIDRSLRSYCKTIEPPSRVSVLYVHVPPDLVGGELVLRCGKRQVAKIQPQLNTLVDFQGDLTHSVNEVRHHATRLSLVCEQYNLSPRELEDIPEFLLESRAIKSKS